MGARALASVRLLTVLMCAEPLTERQRAAIMLLITQVAAELDAQEGVGRLSDRWRRLDDLLTAASRTGHERPPWPHWHDGGERQLP